MGWLVPVGVRVASEVGAWGLEDEWVVDEEGCEDSATPESKAV